MVGRSRIAAFKGIKDRVWKRLQDWKLQFLSQAGKEILLKAVIQAIPTYCMSVFLLPKSLCLEINSLMQQFWWRHQNKSKVHWMSWSRMSLAKADGGLGYRDFESFNKALLAKQGLRLWQQPNSFLSKIMAAKYYKGRCFLESNLGIRPSFAWRSIHSSCELIDSDTKWWNISLLKNIFSKEEVNLILSMPISATNPGDKQIWRGTKNGLFSVKSAYFIQKELERNGTAESSSGTGISKCGRRFGIYNFQMLRKIFYGVLAIKFCPLASIYIKRK